MIIVALHRVKVFMELTIVFLYYCPNFCNSENLLRQSFPNLSFVQTVSNF